MLAIRKFFSSLMGKFSPYPASVENLKSITRYKSNQRYNSYDEVYPRIFLGDAKGAKDIAVLEKLGITHILNAAFGTGSFLQVNTDENFYHEKDFDCVFKGIPAMDILGFDISIYFFEVAEFIESALKTNGKVYIHCYQGVSRSAALVIAYLMIKQNMSAMEAVKWVRSSRQIYPNEGFLDQISTLDAGLKARAQRIAQARQNK